MGNDGASGPEPHCSQSCRWSPPSRAPPDWGSLVPGAPLGHTAWGARSDSAAAAPGRRKEGQAADTEQGGRWERVEGEYLQLGAASLQGFHRQLQGCAIAIHACAHLEDFELGAAVAL